jgi:serine/threonine protein kinase/tetratricopeptide (TPR) repeat protein
MPAQLISHYRILGPLGSGGMGAVYRAEDTTLHRTVALKFLPESAAHTEKVYERLKREASTASALNHPNICTIYEVGEDAGEMFIAMEYIEGRTLAELIRHGPLPIEKVLRYSSQISSALAHAHEKGVIHGDLKPLNIIVTPNGEAKILDFGLARRSNPLEFDRKTLETTASAKDDVGLGGTFPYMAPEQVEGSDASARTDIWSFGIVLYEMISGERAFQGANLFLLCNSILRDQPRTLPPTVPAGVKTVVSRCLEKEPERRYRRAGEVRAALEAVGTSTDQAVVSSQEIVSPGLRNSEPLIPSESKARKRPTVAILSVSLLLVLVVAAGYWFGEKQHPTRETRPSNPRVRSIAIIPFRNAGTEKTYDYFGVGLADVLNAKLTNARILEVRAVPASTSFVGPDVDFLQIGRKLGVDEILSGSYQIEKEILSLRYTLVDLRRNVQVAGKDFQTPFTRAIEAEHQLAAEIMDSLQASVSQEERDRLTAASTQQNEAFRAYLRSSYELELFWRQPSAAQLSRAEQKLNEALQFDSHFTLALVGLAKLHWISAFWGYADDPRILDEAERQANRAIEIEPDSGEAYAVLALIQFQKGNIDQARTCLRVAFARSPNSAVAYYAAGLFYMFKGLPEKSIRAFLRAQELNPELIRRELGLAYRSQGDFLRARDQLQQDLEFHPADQVTAAVLAGVLVGLDDIEGARQIEHTLLRNAPSDPTVQYALALLRVREGASFSIDAWLSRYERVYWADAGYCFDVAGVYALARKPKPALRWLSRARELGVTNYPFVSRNPLYRNLMLDPAVQSFLESTRREWEAANRSEEQDPLMP